MSNTNTNTNANTNDKTWNSMNDDHKIKIDHVMQSSTDMGNGIHVTADGKAIAEIIKSKKISLKKRQEEFGFRIIKDHKFCIQASRHQEDVNRLAAVQKQRVAKVQLERQLAEQQEEVIRLAAKEEAAIVAARQLVEQQEREREQEENARLAVPALVSLSSTTRSEAEVLKKECDKVPKVIYLENVDNSISNNDNEESDKRSRINNIALFLSSVGIGCNPSIAIMNRYGNELFDAGYESVEMIKKYLKEKHIRNFGWMEDLHKEFLVKNLSEIRMTNKTESRINK